MLLLGGLAWLILRGKPAAAAPAPARRPRPPKRPPAALPSKPATIVSPPPRVKVTAPKRAAPKATIVTPGKPPTVEQRITRLAARANQKAALAWIPVLERAGASREEAAGLARWIGIESSGNPLAKSKLGERGLLQIMDVTRKEAGFTDAEWGRMADKATTPETHAAMALKQYRWHVKRAGLAIPPARSATDALWYAKAHHTRPADLRATTMRPDAATAARFAATRAKTPREKLRLAVANMVAFGSAGVS